MRALLLASVLAAALHPPLRGECLSYRPAQVVLEGVLIAGAYPGRPNYQDTLAGDEPEHVVLLTLADPVCVAQDPLDSLVNSAESNVRVLQSWSPDHHLASELRALVGRRVRVRGTLSHAISGHHHTAVTLEVLAVRAA